MTTRKVYTEGNEKTTSSNWCTSFLRSQISLQNLLIVFFTLLVVLVALPIWLYTYVNSTSSMLQIGTLLTQQTLDILTTQIDDHLEYSRPASGALTSIFSEMYKKDANFTNWRDNVQLYRKIWQVFNHSGMYVALEREGWFIGWSYEAGTMEEGFCVEDSQTVFDDVYNMECWYTNSSKLPSELMYRVPWDPRTRPWYTIAKESKSYQYSDIYPYTDNELGITASEPIMADDGTFIGVTCVDFTLEFLYKMLSSATIGKSGWAIVINENGGYIGSSFPVEQVLEGGKFSSDVVKVNETIEPKVSKPVASLQDHYSSFSKLKDVGHFSPLHQWYWNGVNHYIMFSPQKFGSLNLITIIVIPEDDFMKAIKDSNIYLGVIVAIVGIVAILSGIAVSLAVSFPLKHLAKMMNVVTTMELDTIRKTWWAGILYELKMIQDHFLMMVERLKEYRAFLPSTVVNIASGARRDELKEKKSYRSKQSTSSKVTSISSSAATKHDLALQLSVKEVTILSVIIHNVDKLTSSLSYQEYIKIYDRLSRCVVDAAKKAQGDVFLQKDCIDIKWDIPIKRIKSKVAFAALTIKKKLLQENLLSTELQTDIDVSIIVCTSNATCGTLGCAKLKSMIHFGAIEEVKKIMKFLAKQCQAVILINEVVAQYLRETHKLRPVKSFKTSEKTQEAFILDSQQEKMKQDEWMYELETKKRQDKEKSYEAGFAEFKKGNFSNALSLFETYLEVYKDDKVTMYFANLCRQYEKEKPQEGYAVFSLAEVPPEQLIF